ncbi:multicopper oxidase [Biscogniauxia marginata]|nr:multicopper oxidase [Biscogniauxia marginata]
MHLITFLSGLSAIVSYTFVNASPLTHRQQCQFDSATAPECWGDFSLSTNWYDEVPDTGVVREYWLDIVNGTAAPDGFERMVLTVNGSFPGPTIEADWGDTVVVHVHNSLQNNGTSIHFHGIRQNHTNDADGVASITQCPSAPGDDLTYTFRATQYGTTWYHSHFSLQAWNGVAGPIIINGPASAPYDEDKGTIFLTDWFHRTSDQLYAQASSGGPPTPENGLINGLNVWEEGGSRFQTSFTAGTSYRLRLINGAMDNHFKFSIDNHTLTVIAADLVPVVPYTTNMVSIGIGQRYDVIVEANQEPGNYWMRAIPQLACGTNDMTLDIRGIVSYDGVDAAEPTSLMWTYDDTCNDEPLEGLVPFVPIDAQAAQVQEILDAGLAVVDGFFKWTINSNSFLSDWGEPTLEKVLNTGATFREDENIITLNEQNQWVYLVVESQLGLVSNLLDSIRGKMDVQLTIDTKDHPIHLHGHDFFILAQEGMATFDDASPLNLVNPMRRDVAMLPASGYVVMAFQSDNPGVWLAHCHIGWHTSQGFALQLVERNSEIAATINEDVLANTCAAWNEYATANEIEQEDSGV